MNCQYCKKPLTMELLPNLFLGDNGPGHFIYIDNIEQGHCGDCNEMFLSDVSMDRLNSFSLEVEQLTKDVMNNKFPTAQAAEDELNQIFAKWGVKDLAEMIDGCEELN